MTIRRIVMLLFLSLTLGFNLGTALYRRQLNRAVAEMKRSTELVTQMSVELQRAGETVPSSSARLGGPAMPRTERHRIVKPRSAKQRAHADRVRSYSMARRAVDLDVRTCPSTSWWLNLSREQLQQRVIQERARIAWSKFGRLAGSGALEE